MEISRFLPARLDASDAEIAVLNIGGACQLFRVSGPHYAAAFDDGVTVGNPGESIDVLVDHQDRLSGGAELLQAAPDFVADQRREAFGRLVENKQPRIGHE